MITNRLKSLTFWLICFGLCAGLIPGKIWARDLLEIFHKKATPTGQTDKKVFQALTKGKDNKWGNYYYKIYSASKEDIMLDKATKLPATEAAKPQKVLLNGQEISYERYQQILKSGKLNEYKVLHYQNTEQGLMQLGEIKKGTLFKPKPKFLKIAVSAKPPGAWYTSPYVIGGVVVAAAASGGPSSSSSSPTPSNDDPPPYTPPPSNPPASPSGLIANAVSSSQINLNWNDESTNENGFQIQRKTGIDGTYIQIDDIPPGSFSYPDLGRSPDTTYYYRIRAYNGDGNSNWSNEAWDTTSITVPFDPSGLTATAVSSSQINLEWDDNSDNEDGFEIWRKTITDTYVAVDTVGPDVTIYNDTPLTPSTTCWYKVRAWNGAGNSDFSNGDDEVSATTQAAAGAVPDDPTGLTATAVSSSQINLEWDDNSDNEWGFEIWRKTITDTYTAIDTVLPNVTIYNDTPLTPSTTCWYKVRAWNGVGNSNFSNGDDVISATTQAAAIFPPDAPGPLTATAVAWNQINLEWNDNSDNEDGFKIERKKEGDVDFFEIDIVGAGITSYYNTNLSPNIFCTYRVRAYNGIGNSGYSNEDSDLTFNPLANTPWPKFHRDMAQTGRSNSAGPTNGKLEWYFQVDNNIKNSPVIGRYDAIYIGVDGDSVIEGTFYSFDKNGAKRWSMTFGYDFTFTSAAIARDGTVYVGTSTPTGGKLMALDPDDGNFIWEYPEGGSEVGVIESAPAIASDGTVYFGDNNGDLYAIKQTGDFKWKYSAGSAIKSSPVIGSDGAIYFAAAEKLYAVKSAGTDKWAPQALGVDITSSPAINATLNRLYIGVETPAAFGRLFAINTSNGTTAWQYPAAASVGMIESSPAIGPGDMIYFGSNDGYLYALNPVGSERWKYNPSGGDPIWSSPAIGNNTPNPLIYVGCWDGYVYAISDTGAAPLNPVWSYDTGGQITYSSPAIASDGTLYIASAGAKKLYAFNDSGTSDPYAEFPQPMFRTNIKRTGQTKFLGPLSPYPDNPISTSVPIESSPAIDKKGIMYVGDISGNFTAYNPDGSVYWTTNIGGAPIKSTPALGLNDTVYFGAANGIFYAYDMYPAGAPTANQKWAWNTGISLPLDSSPVITGPASTPILYFGSDAGRVYKLEDNSGTPNLIWTYNPSAGAISSSPALSSDGNTIYIGLENTNRLLAITDNGPTASLKWNATVNGYVQATPLIAPPGSPYPNRIYFGTTTGYFYSISDGGGSATFHWGTPLSFPGPIEASAAMARDGTGTLYVGCTNGYFYAITDNGGSGSQKWGYYVVKPIRSSAVVDAQGFIYFGRDYDGVSAYVYALKDTGSPELQAGWPYGASNSFTSSPAISNNGTLCIGCQNGYFYILGGDPADIRITKKANKQQVTIGDVITYKITLTNDGVDPTEPTRTTTVIDDIPPGFKYIKKSSRLSVEGAKATVLADPTGQTILTFDVGDFAVGETKELTYQLVVGSGVTFGKYENRAYARYYYNRPPITLGKSNTARETVRVVPDPLFDLGTIIGKVFVDSNENGIQDKGETGVGESKIIMEDGTIITTDKDGKYHVPGVAPGTHLLKLEVKGQKLKVTTDNPRVVRITEGLLSKVNFGVQPVDVAAGLDPAQTNNGNGDRKGRSYNKNDTVSSLTIVALGEGILGHSKVSEDINADLHQHAKNDRRFKDGRHGKGKIAGYLKANIAGKYKITSSLDTERTRNRELFRYIDPDKYYPLYGDDSTVSWDATNTQGPVYLLVETTPKSGLGTSSFLWGNYSTSLNETKLATYNRTLYGSQIKVGTNKLRINGFGAEAYQIAAHNELRATGGSFYYLKHKDVIEGSEQIRLEVRDKLSHLPLVTNAQTRDVDYKIDYDNGRIIFDKPVGSVSTSHSIISTNILDGNPVYVIVDYEYQPDRLHFKKGSYGGRVSYSPINSANLGVTYVSEEEDDKDYQLKGTDTTLNLPLKTTLKAEYAETESRGVPGFISLNGGFTFNEVSATTLAEGSAYRISSNTRSSDRSALDTYYQRIRPGFSTAGSITQQSTEKYGAVIEHELIKDRLSLRATHDAQELLRNPNAVSSALIGGRKTEVSGLQGIYTKENLTLTGEYRYQKVKDEQINITSETNNNTALGAVRASYVLSAKTSVFLEQQSNFKGLANHQTTAGVSTELRKGLNASLRGTSGTRGNSALLGVNSQISDKTEVYTNFGYGVTEGISDTSRKERTTSTALGSTSQITPSTRVYTQEEYRTSSSARSTATAVGQKTDLSDKWQVGCSFERGLINNFSGTETIRQTGSLKIGYNDQKKLNVVTKLETRSDKGDDDRQQYLTSNSARYKLTKDVSLLGNLNWSKTENDLTETTDARFKESTIGFALRPVDWDKINIIGKYTCLNDQKPMAQDSLGVDETEITKERATVYSLEVVYDIDRHFQLVEKYAFKNGQEKVGSRDYTDSDTDLLISRINYHLTNKWDAGLEYRILHQKLADDQKAGYLGEVLYKISGFFQLGAGYNFTDFTDDLINNNDFSARGPFIRLVATFAK